MERKVNKGEYLSPQCEAIEMQMAGVIAVSADNVDVRDPWGSSSEEDW